MMRKIQKLIVSLIGCIVYSQQLTLEPTPANNVDKTYPVTPETYSLFKAGEIPVDYRTGKLNVTVPIYNIQTKTGLNLPINLTYNTAGIKVDEISSTVGLGWSLAIPNSIIIEQYGLSDLKHQRWLPINPGDYEYDEVNLLSVLEGSKLLNIENESLDTQPDIFHYNLPTVSGSFVRDSAGNFHSVPYENIKINYLDNEQYSFQIIDDKGNKYLYNKTGTWSNVSSSGTNNVNINSFFLKKIILTNNEEITFSYQKNMIVKSEFSSFEDLYQSVDYLIDGGCAFNPTDQSSTSYRNNFEYLITEISYANVKVQFNYTSNIAGMIGRKDLNVTDPTQSFALNNIIIKDDNGRSIKNFQLLQSYFVADNNSTDFKNFRLKLNAVQEIFKNENYSFEYQDTNLPKLNTFGQDLWGYYNGNDNNTSLIPNLRYVNGNYTKSKDYTALGADRSVDPFFSQAFILKKVNYPTGGFSKFEFENNTIWKKILIPDVSETQYGYLQNSYNSNQGIFQLITAITSPNDYFYFNNITNNAVLNEEIWVEFTNSCSNTNNSSSSLPENGESYGVAYLEEQVNGTWFNLVTFDLGNTHGVLDNNILYNNPQAPKRIRIVRNGNCSISLRVYKKSFSKENNQNNIVGGLRIKKITDSDGQTNNDRFFKYSNINTLASESSGFFQKPLKFADIYKAVKKGVDANDFVCSAFRLGADQTINSSISGNDIFAYEYVTEEKLGKGKTLYKFTNNGLQGVYDITIVGNNTFFNPFDIINKEVVQKTIYDKNEIPLRRVINNYIFDYSKNALSADYLHQSIAFSTKFNIYRLLKYCMGGYGCIMHTTEVGHSFPINSGKFLLSNILSEEYLNGNLINSSSSNLYNTNIFLPLTLQKNTFLSPDGSVTETTYQYAHEKGNQRLINANMIGIPLETTVIKKQNAPDPGKTISKTETKYDNPAHLFPTSVLSFDFQNTASTELTYDQYDNKGNILQYTTKDGISTSIIWGYNSTQPIAKVTGATYAQISSLASAIVSASNLDAANPANEPALITALDNFRKDSSLAGMQITTYTYDPLIGVTSITPPSGIREIYKYDAANRLEKIVDINGKILKEFKYNYKN